MCIRDRVTYWYGGVGTSQPVEQTPNYEPPLKPLPHANFDSTSILYNGVPKTVHIIYPGLYTQSLNIPFNGDANDIYRFMNGVYYFQDASLNISGGIVSNTSTGKPVPGPFGGVTDLPAASDGTNGVEFVFDGNASFSATTSGTTSPSVFFTAPSFVSSGTDSIAFFIKTTDTISGPNGSPWNESIDGTKPTYGGYPFQIWGSVFNADMNGSHGTVVTLQAASTSVYAVTGEVVSPQVDLNGGNLVNGAYTPSNPGTPPPSAQCNPNGYVANPAGLLDQFNPHYVPHWRGLAYLVK